MKAAWVRFSNLSRGEQRDFLLGVILLPLAAISLRAFPFRRVQRTAERWCGGAAAKPRSDAVAVAEAVAASRMMNAASRRGLVRGNCLSQSMALWWLLRRRGIAVQLRLGGRKNGARLEAHAWVELAGRAINDSEDVAERYAPFEGPVTAAMVARK